MGQFCRYRSLKKEEVIIFTVLRNLNEKRILVNEAHMALIAFSSIRAYSKCTGTLLGCFINLTSCSSELLCVKYVRLSNVDNLTQAFNQDYESGRLISEAVMPLFWTRCPTWRREGEGAFSIQYTCTNVVYEF